LWREEKSEPGYDPAKPITRPLYSDRADAIVYTEKGTIHCICPATGEQVPLPAAAEKSEAAGEWKQKANRPEP